MHIAVFSDVICPWCFIGKRRLERALGQAGLAGETAIGWLPFELNPDMPPDGMARADYRSRKFGAERAAELDRQIGEVGAEDGIRFDFARQRRTPSTRCAHMLIAHANRKGRGDAVVEALFTAYFEKGLDIGEEAVLTDIAASAGLDREKARAAVYDEALRSEVLDRESEAARLGISGVPFFIVERKWAVSGAQPTDAWLEALRRIRGGLTDAAAPK